MTSELQEDCDPVPASARQVRAVASGISEADNTRDLGRVLQYYASDAMLPRRNEPPITGQRAIHSRYVELSSGFTPAIEGRIHQACVSGSMAFVRGHNGGRLLSRTSGETRYLDDVYIMLMRKDSEGAWRITHLMWHRASKVPAGNWRLRRVLSTD